MLPHIMFKSFFSHTGSRNSLYFKLDYKRNGYKLSAKRFPETDLGRQPLLMMG